MLKPLLLAALIGAAGYAVDQFGYQRAANLYAGKLATADATHSRALLRLTEQRLAEQATAQAEYQRLNQLAHQVGVELLQSRAELATTQRQLKQRIPHVTHSDGPRFTGLGPDSLRLYRQFLGYSAADLAADLPPADTGNAGEATAPASAAAGLPPDDLLKHAADYGAWCQQLDQQLNSYISLHQQAPGV
ncbi:hypothetical protein [Vogesella sp. AC12]|uniref:hypothetical protein n=1 Tax=Vogesella sp. AC12 TaxID=2950550 RepID=UPI00210B8F77|nr:hypothetical protein [Vogesella sp. AC12]MCQ4142823.1 hypothetical protein [Vogesella sp. AC12]